MLISKRRGLDSDILEKDQDTKNSQFIKTLMSDELKMFRDEKKEDAEVDFFFKEVYNLQIAFFRQTKHRIKFPKLIHLCLHY